MRVAFLSGSMWMSLTCSPMAFRNTMFTRPTTGLSPLAVSRSRVSPSSRSPPTEAARSASDSDARNPSMSVVVPVYFRMNSVMFPSIASTGRMVQPVNWRKRSTMGRDCGSAIATVSVS